MNNLRLAPRLLARRITPSPRALPSLQLRLSSSDYGTPAPHDPKPDQPNPSADKEHPGPPPPKVGHNTGSTPTKGTADGHNTPSPSSSGQKDTKRGFATHAARRAEPKIHNEGKPAGDANEDVRKHNEDFEKRADRSVNRLQDGVEQGGEKVDKEFWKDSADRPKSK